MRTYALFIFAFLIPANTCAAQSVDQVKWTEQGMVRNVFDLAKNSRIRKELEIVDFQLEGLKNLKTEYTRRLNRISEETESLPKVEAKKARTRLWNEINDTTIKKLKKILLPHQLQRLNQIAKQGPIKIVANGDRCKMYVIMARQLGLDDKEMETFKENVAKEKAEYEKRLADLTRETDHAVFEKLPTKTRARLKEVFGEIF